MSYEELALGALKLETVELVMLRHRIQREIYRRYDCVVVGKHHSQNEIEAFDAKRKLETDGYQALQGGDVELSVV